MKRFRFSLEQVLHWRRIQFDQAALRLQQLEQERSALEKESEELESGLQLAIQQVTGKLLIDPQELRSLAIFQTHIERRKEELAATIQGCIQRIAQQKKQCVHAHTELRLLEKLKERRLDEWRKLTDRELDELASETFLAQWARVNRSI
ncbi:MAG: flagellar FliJ family protein [Bryobacteraceae bacterium]